MLKQLQLFGSGRLRGLWPSPEFSRVLFAPQTQDIFPIKEMYVFIEKCNSHCNHKHSNIERNAFPIHINSGVNPGMRFCPFKWQCHELHHWGELFQWQDLYPLSHWGQRQITSEKETRWAHQPVGMRGHSSQWDVMWRLTGMGKASSWLYGSCNILQETPWLGLSFASTLASRGMNCLVPSHCYCRLCLHFSVMSLPHRFKEIKSSSSWASPHTLLWLDTFPIA